MVGAGTAPPRRAKKPVWQEVEEQEGRSSGRRSRAKGPKRGGRRYAVVYDTRGPKVRLGVAWFMVAAGALAVGPLATALVYGVAAAVAAAQMARCWRKRRL